MSQHFYASCGTYDTREKSVDNSNKFPTEPPTNASLPENHSTLLQGRSEDKPPRLLLQRQLHPFQILRRTRLLAKLGGDTE